MARTRGRSRPRTRSPWWIATAVSAASVGLSPCSASAAAPGACLPDPGPGSVYLCDPLNGSSVGDVHGGQFVADDGWQANVRADGIHYDLGQVVSEGHLSFWMKGLGDAALPNNDHIVLVLDNGPWADGDPNCRWAEIKIWGVVDPGEGTIFNIGGNFCGGPNIVSDHDHAFYDPSHWYHFEIIHGAGGASWKLDDVELATATYACPMTFTDLYLPKRLDNQAEDPAIGAVYANLSFVGTPAADPCDGDAHCSDGVQNCGELGLDCGVAPCGDCPAPDAGDATTGDVTTGDVTTGDVTTGDANGGSGGAGPGEDSGWVPVDAGLDARVDGAGTDAAEAGGPPPSGGNATDAEDGGCGCRIEGARRSADALSWVVLALGVLGLGVRCRRRASPFPHSAL